MNNSARHLFAILVGAIFAVGIVGLINLNGDKTFSVHGDFTLHTSSFSTSGSSCQGERGFNDIREGAQVIVTDAHGTTVAVGQLGAGEMTKVLECTFQWEVTGIPEGSTFYSIEVSHRGKLQYSRADLDRELHLTLGSS